MHFCTVCDKNYLLKGISMFHSLQENVKEPFTLHWLCMDLETYDVVRTLAPNEIKAYLLADLEQSHAEVRLAKNNPNPGPYGTAYSQYCWALAPFFLNYVLELKEVAALDYVFYVDTDILFYKSPVIITEIMGNKQIGLHSHRFGRPYQPEPVGWFNVGIVVFRKTMSSVLISHEWKYWLLTTTHQYYDTHGGCGDQKYLELIWEHHGDSVCIFDQDTSITHLAPWCTDIEPGKVVLFYHFSHFRHDIANNTWYDSNDGEWKPAEQPNIRPYYEDYFYRIKQSHYRIKPKLSIVGNIHITEDNMERITWLRCTLRSFAFLKDHCELVLNFDGCTHAMRSLITKELMECPLEQKISFISGNTYGEMYMYLLSQARFPFILNFLEDHFCVLEKPEQMIYLLQRMEMDKVDVCKASFWEIENNSIKHIPGLSSGHQVYCWLNDEERFKCYQQHYGDRFYIGVNFLTTKAFAEKFWKREIDSHRPHEWEIGSYTPEFEHIAMVPAFRVLVAIDDDHGEPGTALINNIVRHPKFEEILDRVTNGRMKIV